MKDTENPSVVWKKLVFKKKMNQKKSKELLDFRGDWNCTKWAQLPPQAFFSALYALNNSFRVQCIRHCC